MPSRDKGGVEEEKAGGAVAVARARRFLRHYQLVEGRPHDVIHRLAVAETVAEVVHRVAADVLRDTPQDYNLQLISDVSSILGSQANRPQPASDPDEVEMQALMHSIDKDLVVIHQQIDRVLARWDDG